MLNRNCSQRKKGVENSEKTRAHDDRSVSKREKKKIKNDLSVGETRRVSHLGPVPMGKGRKHQPTPRAGSPMKLRFGFRLFSIFCSPSSSNEFSFFLFFSSCRLSGVGEWRRSEAKREEQSGGGGLGLGSFGSCIPHSDCADDGRILYELQHIMQSD